MIISYGSDAGCPRGASRVQLANVVHGQDKPTAADLRSISPTKNGESLVFSMVVSHVPHHKNLLCFPRTLPRGRDLSPVPSFRNPFPRISLLASEHPTDSSSCVTGSTDRILAVYLQVRSSVHELNIVSGIGSPTPRLHLVHRHVAGFFGAKNFPRNSLRRRLSDTGMPSGLASCAAMRSEILPRQGELRTHMTHTPRFVAADCRGDPGLTEASV